MKKVLGLTLLAVMMLGISTASAQKFARINSQEIIMAMPELAEIQKNLEALEKDWAEQLEQIQVEFNNKMLNYEKNQATMTPATKQVKQQELQQLQQRYGEIQQLAQQDMQKKQAELFEPVHKKAQDAINKIAKAAGYLAVFESGTLVYFDAAQLVDIAPLVKKELGIVEKPATK